MALGSILLTMINWDLGADVHLQYACLSDVITYPSLNVNGGLTLGMG